MNYHMIDECALVFFKDDILDFMKLLEHAIYSNKPKNVDIFPLAEKVKGLILKISTPIFCFSSLFYFRFVVEHMVCE